VKYPNLTAAIRLPVHKRMTFGVYAPRATHERKATCAEVGCLQQHNGYTLRLATDQQDARLLEHWVARRLDGLTRHYIKRPDGSFTIYAFPAGTPCLKAARHTVSLHRPPFHVVRGGDHRGTVGDPTYHSADGWINRFGEHQDQLASAVNGSPS
jgi:hypothetical protein